MLARWCWEWDSGAGTTNDYCDISNDCFNDDDVHNDNYDISNDYTSDDVDDVMLMKRMICKQIQSLKMFVYWLFYLW